MGRKKKQRKTAMESNTLTLPCEIIYNVLSKLPVKSLLRFRCVCKSWLLVISEPQFIKTHLNQSIKLDRQRLICFLKARPGCLYYIDYETNWHNSTEKLYLPLKKLSGYEIRGSCNGLVLLGPSTDGTGVLWNPSTRTYTKFSCPFYYEFSFCGLCYDSSTDDYKVVVITDRGGREYHSAVFTTRANSWTEFRKFTHVPVLSKTGVNVNEMLHFIVKSSNYIPPDSSGYDNNSHCQVLNESSSRTTNANIIFFDAVNEKFEEMPPPIRIGDEKDVFGLIVVKGCLGLYCSTPNERQAEVWVMKEYGEMNLWTKLFIIQHTLQIGLSNIWRLLCVTKKGKIVMVMGQDDMVIYNPKKNTFGSVVTPAGMGNFRAIPFVDSLVLPTGQQGTQYSKGKEKSNIRRDREQITK